MARTTALAEVIDVDGGRFDQPGGELRWFVPGNLMDLPARRVPQVRVDAYHLGSLTPGSAWKRRGNSGAYEWKRRVGDPHTVVFDGVVGSAEHWTKRRVGNHPSLAGRWLEVTKSVWSTGRVQVAVIAVEGREWTTVAVDLRGWRQPSSIKAFAPWREVIRAAGTAASYPAWLLTVGGFGTST